MDLVGHLFLGLSSGDFMELTNENIHLRTSHSKMMGCWTTEYGGSLNEVLHMWQYGLLFALILIEIIMSIKTINFWFNNSG